MNKFNELRNKYKEFIYNSYSINNKDNYMEITYNFVIPNLIEFNPKLRIKTNIIKNTNQDYINELVFNIGLIELISYVKSTCSPNIIIKAGYVNDYQINWLKKIYYNGLGEFLYKNNIKIDIDSLFNITCTKSKNTLPNISYQGLGNLIPVGGGKDSAVTLELLKGSFKDNSCFIINPKIPSISCCEVAGYTEENIMSVERILDRKIITLNEEGFLNGHTPFSAIVAFTSLLVAFLTNKKYIVLSNEASANESTVLGTNINHQYSKTYEFENDFNNYIKEVFNIDIRYFSMLRPLSEYQIGMLFSTYPKYHKIFRSCNLGSKEKTWNWCCICPKCLFVYTILSPFLYKEQLINIFGTDLFENKYLLETFIEILGYSKTKPFECVGTYGEARYAVSILINKIEYNDLPYLLKYYKDNYPLQLKDKLETRYNKENNLDKEFELILKKELNNVQTNNK